MSDKTELTTAREIASRIARINPLVIRDVWLDAAEDIIQTALDNARREGAEESEKARESFAKMALQNVENMFGCLCTRDKKIEVLTFKCNCFKNQNAMLKAILKPFGKMYDHIVETIPSAISPGKTAFTFCGEVVTFGNLEAVSLILKEMEERSDI